IDKATLTKHLYKPFGAVYVAVVRFFIAPAITMTLRPRSQVNAVRCLCVSAGIPICPARITDATSVFSLPATVPNTEFAHGLPQHAFSCPACARLSLEPWPCALPL